MKKYNYEIGKHGESLSIQYLKNNKHTILAQNFKYKRGEVDIITKTSDDIIVFTEVKSRYTDNYGVPIESVTYFKRKQIIFLSKQYIRMKNLHDFNIRYDVIEVIFNSSNNNFKINHYEDAYRIE